MNKPLSPALQKLLAEFGRKLPEKLTEIRQLHIEKTAPDDACVRDYYMAVHKLAGSSGSYGFPLVSQSARELDRYLSDVLACEKNYAADVALGLLEAIAKVIVATPDNP